MKINDLRIIDRALYNCFFQLHSFEIFAGGAPNISFVGIDRKNAQLFIQFADNKTYIYLDVTNDAFDKYKPGITGAGNWLASCVKGFFRYEQVYYFVEPANLTCVAEQFKSLQHEYDTSRGLWCTDKEPDDKTNFFQL